MCAKVTVDRPSDWAGDCSRVTAMAVAAEFHRISLLEESFAKVASLSRRPILTNSIIIKR